MDVQQKRERFFEELRREIRSSSVTAADLVSGKEDLPQIGEVQGYKVLRQRLTSNEDVDALRRVVADVCEGLVHSILCMFDGVSLGINDELVPGIIDAETGENLAPEGIPWHDSFYDYLYEHEDDDRGQ